VKVINNNLTAGELIDLKDEKWLKNQRIAGKIVAGALMQLENYCINKTFHSMATLNEITERYIIEHGGIPTFKNYPKKGGPNFPAGLCISVNKILTHGIGDDTVLNDGDVVSFDLGVTYDDAIADSAFTCIFGQPQNSKHEKLVLTTKECLSEAIKSIKVGKRLGCIGKAIFSHAAGKGFGVITQYGGHGISKNKAHAPPFVSNKSTENEGIRLCEGMTLAIEPLLVIGSSTETKTGSDGWSVYCKDIAAHEEHTIFIHSDHIEIITWRENETVIKEPRIYF